MTQIDEARERLAPCPFCGGGNTHIEPNGRVWSGQGYSEPISVSVRHWCEKVEGQPSRMIERVGRDEAYAIAAWNRRAAAPAAEPALVQAAPGLSLAYQLAAHVGQAPEWWFRDPVVGGFVADESPFELATATCSLVEAAMDALEAMEAANRAALSQAGVGCVDLNAIAALRRALGDA